MNFHDDLHRAAERLVQILAEKQQRVVFAESCTAGLVAATLGRIAGVSEYLCGSAVVYRESTKRDWLAVAERTLERHTAVSEPVVRQMAVGILEKTPEADWSASVTGHLGPDAPQRLDGLIYLAVAWRENQRARIARTWRYRLQSTQRHQRQREAARLVLQRLCETLRRG